MSAGGLMRKDVKGNEMPRYLIEGSCDGSLFAESIEAPNREEAEAAAVERLCEAWGESGETLDDLGDCAMVSEYSADDYARDAGPELLAFVQQIARMCTTTEAKGVDLGNDDAMDGLITRARKLSAVAEGRA
jgi:hypothetical protein